MNFRFNFQIVFSLGPVEGVVRRRGRDEGRRRGPFRGGGRRAAGRPVPLRQVLGPLLLPDGVALGLACSFFFRREKRREKKKIPN